MNQSARNGAGLCRVLRVFEDLVASVFSEEAVEEVRGPGVPQTNEPNIIVVVHR